MDGIFGHHLGEGDEQEALVRRILRLIAQGAADQGRGYRKLERTLRSVEALPLVDPFLAAAADELSVRDAESVGLRLATESGYRNSVKFGVALLGVVPTRAHRDILMTLGRHDEFTLFSGVALARTEPDGDTALWELAQVVTGCGRIHLVERLKNTAREDVRDWILREGFRNDVMNEYLAYIAATTGNLARALESDAPDEQLIDAACDIVTALISGGPAEEIDDYGDAPRALELLVGHLRTRARTVRQFLSTHEIARFLRDEPDEWAERERLGWPAGLRERLQRTCQEIMDRPAWKSVALAGLASTDAAVFWEAERAAHILGLDTFEESLARLAADPLDANWFTVMARVDEARVERVLDLACASLPLADVATGPALDLGFGPQFQTTLALSFIVQELGRFPGHGWPLIATALRSPVINNRHGALTTLRDWGPSRWPPEAAEALRAASHIEPDKEIRGLMKQLLSGKR